MPKSSCVVVALSGLCCLAWFSGARAWGASSVSTDSRSADRCITDGSSACQNSTPQVRVLRGSSIPAGACESASCKSDTPRVEIVSPGGTGSWSVTVVRIGTGIEPSAPLGGRPQQGTVSGGSLTKEEFRDAAGATVTLVRGSVSPLTAVDRITLTSGLELDRIAFAVEGVESNHGQNPAMWRDDLRGPQGPMQISQPAALDIGGGDRFDISENRSLGKAYLAHLRDRYGNWSDAIAAYNWGPGRLDTWISDGRPEDRLPISVHHYLSRVLKNSGLGAVDAAAR